MSNIKEVPRRRTGAVISVLVATILGLSPGRLAAQPHHNVPTSARHQAGIASWYGKHEAGRSTASGAVFDPSRLSAAHRSLPFGTCVHVMRFDNGRSVVVPINDRGPYKSGRLIDVSEAAAVVLDMKEDGLVRVQIDVVPACPVRQAEPGQALASASAP